MSLLDSIRMQIRQQGDMPFVDFMHQALYTPTLGYYSSGLQKFGVNGDFITAPELTPLFGKTLANQLQQVLSGLEHPIIFEFGAGSGKLCIDILTHLENFDNLPDEYHILEVSADLQVRQRDLIYAKIPHLINRIKWLKEWPIKPFNGVIIANEVLDAMPVHRFLQTKDNLCESYIRLTENNELLEVFKPCVNLRLSAHVDTILPKDLYPYQSEVNLFIDDWIKQCYAMLEKGAFFIIDYGFPRHEYYHPDRSQGTLMCHHRHLAKVDPLAHVGDQDITAHVDFTHVAEVAHNSGFHVSGYTNFAAFLLNNGFLSLLPYDKDDTLDIKMQQAVKLLLQPSEMGELFKVMALTKDLDLQLNGFLEHDKRASL